MASSEVPRRGEGAEGQAEGEERSLNGTLHEVLTQKIPHALAAVPQHGQAAVGQVVRVLRRPATPASAAVLHLERRVAALEAELKLERTVTEFLEGEAIRVETALERERLLAEESVARAELLEDQMANARRTTLKLITAARASLALLKRVRLDLVENGFLDEALNPLLRDLREVAQAAQELESFALLRETPAPAV